MNRGLALGRKRITYGADAALGCVVRAMAPSTTIQKFFKTALADGDGCASPANAMALPENSAFVKAPLTLLVGLST